MEQILRDLGSVGITDPTQIRQVCALILTSASDSRMLEAVEEIAEMSNWRIENVKQQTYGGR